MVLMTIIVVCFLVGFGLIIREGYPLFLIPYGIAVTYINVGVVALSEKLLKK